ncbi:MAG: metal-dependent hydrolase [Bacteroidetes bacterium]|nr:metal-dependent hydrolase [Bacteroidota bacterium]
MKITYYGHSCFGVEIKGEHLLFDPFIAANPLASHIDPKKIKADYILQSHGHFDHISDTVSIAKNTGATVAGSYEITEWLTKQGVEKTHPMNTGGKWRFDFGRVKCVNAVHSSSLPDGTYGGAPVGFVVESEEGNFYYSGDTALTYDMKLIGEIEKINFAFLPVGDNFTMGADSAMIASDFIKCNNIIGMHFDTFGYIKINHEKAKKKFSDAGKELTLMKIGETIEK